ncbi:NAD-dependent epimerase/dehydratase family protein [Flavobacterium macacae]|nr:NAD-dependent epimerase/dehydratase family protein [Flavobacterium macacae]
MKTIITGSSGFVGKNLTAYLNKQDIEVQDLSLRATDWKSHTDKHATGIIHLAGKAHDTANTSSAEEYFKVNRDLTIELFQEFLKSDIKDFFFFSSVKATADTVSGVLKEDHLTDPKTPYGQSKLQAEEYLLSKPIPEGKRVFIIRPCMIHGPGNKGNLNLLYNVVKKGIPYPLAAFDNQRSFLSIDNLNFLIASMLENKGVASGVYNFADDEMLSTTELVRVISVVSGKEPKLLSIPKGIITTIAKVGDLIKFPLNSESVKKLTENYCVSNQKIKNALKIEKMPITAQKGIEKTIKSFIK